MFLMSSFIRKSGLMLYPETLAAVQEAKDLNLQGFLSEVLKIFQLNSSIRLKNVNHRLKSSNRSHDNGL